MYFLSLTKNIASKTVAMKPNFRVKVMKPLNSGEIFFYSSYYISSFFLYFFSFFLSLSLSILSESEALILVCDSPEVLTSNPYCKQISLHVISV